MTPPAQAGISSFSTNSFVIVFTLCGFCSLEQKRQPSDEKKCRRLSFTAIVIEAKNTQKNPLFFVSQERTSFLM